MPGGDVRNVQVNLTANVSPFQSAMQDASAATAKAAQGVTSLGKSLDNMVKSAGHKMTFIGASDIAGLSAAAEAANRFAISMTQVRANSAVTGQSVGALTNSVVSLSRSIPDSTNNIARLEGQIQSLGVQGTANIQNMTKIAEELAAATNTAPGQLLSGILQLNRQMGNGLQTVNQYASSVVALSKTFGTNASDITNFATSISSVAQTAGYTQTQVLGLAAAFTRAGADSSAAATVFTTITSEITEAVVTGSAQLTQFANIVGMTTQSFKTLAQSNPAKALTDILSAIHNQGQAGIVTLQQLGLDGPRSLRVISSLTGGQANLAQSMNVASTAYSQNTALTKSANAAWDTLSSSMQKMRNNIDDIVVRLGGPMADALNIMVKGVNAILGPLNIFMGYLGPIPGIVAGIGGAVLAVTGIFTSFSLAILAAVGAWRALSGMTGTNLLQGLGNGMRRPQGEDPFLNPMTLFGQRRITSFDKTAEEGGRSNAARRFYSGAFGLGQRITAPPPEDPNWAQRTSARIGGTMGAVVRFPLTKLHSEVKEAGDTLRHPLNYEARDSSMVNKYSMLGMWQQAQTGSTALGQHLRSAGSTLAGALPFGLGSKLSGALAPSMKVDANTTEAQAKVDALHKEASAPAVMTVQEQSDFVRNGPGIGPTSMPWPGAAAGLEEGEEATSGGMFAMLARGAGTATSAMGTMAGALSSVALPALILGPAIGIAAHYIDKLHDSAQNAANSMDDFGSQLAQEAGATYIKPSTSIASQAGPADKIVPFGSQERTTATDSAFLSANNTDIGQLQSFTGSNSTNAAQLMVNNVIANANSGQPMTSSEQTVLREQLIAAYGPARAQQIYQNLKMNGITGAAASQLSSKLLQSTKDDSSFWQNPFQGKNSSKQIMDAVTPIANQIVSNPAQAALSLVGLQQGLKLPTGSALAALHSGYAKVGRGYAAPNVLAEKFPDLFKFQSSMGDLVTQLNKGQTGSARINVNTSQVFSVSDFIKQLQGGSQRAKELAANLQSAGLNLNDLSGSVKALTESMKDNQNAQQIAAISRTRLQGMANGMGNFDLTNPSNANYASGMYALQIQSLQTGRQRNSTSGLSPVNEQAIKRAITTWSQYESTISTSSQAFQGVSNVISALNSQLDAQQQIFQTAGSQASSYADQAQQLISMFGTSGQMGANEQGLMQSAQGAISTGESNLKSYMTQVYQSHIQMQQGEQDYNIQMSHMWRDYNIQQKEALYERNVQVTEANWEFQDQLRTMKFATADAFGAPGAMVQAQMTSSASTQLMGMKQQVTMLQQSKQALDQLHNMGLSEGAIRLAGLDDPTNVQQAQEDIADFAQNPQLINQWNKSFAKRLSLAQGLDTDANNSKFADMKREFDHTADLATAAFNNSQQQTNLAFNNELSDFTQQYTITVNREMLQLNEIGQNLYTSFAQLNKAALDSGLKDIEAYAKGIDKAITGVQNTTENFNRSAANIGNSGAGSSTAAEGPQVTGVPTGFHRAANDGVNTGFLLSNISKPGTSMDSYGNPNLHWGKNVAVAPAPKNLSANARLAKNLAGSWGKGVEWDALYQIWEQESGFDTTAGSPNAAYGIPQADPGSKMAAYGANWKTDPTTQIAWGLDDIHRNYGDPLGAWAHKSRTGWYANGGIATAPQLGVVAEAGAPEAMIPLNSTGVTFLAQVMETLWNSTGVNATSFAMNKASSYAAPVVNIQSVNNSWDQSSNFSGTWNIVAQNYNDLVAQLQQQQRLQALTKPRTK